MPANELTNLLGHNPVSVRLHRNSFFAEYVCVCASIGYKEWVSGM